MSSLPLAKPELRPSLAPHHAASRSQDDSGERGAPRGDAAVAPAPVTPRPVFAGINVSRNPSDASEKSLSSAAPDDEAERERGAERAVSDDAEKRSEKSVEREEERRSVDREESEREDRHK